jgi:hypothetical protein
VKFCMSSEGLTKLTLIGEMIESLLSRIETSPIRLAQVPNGPASKLLAEI